MANLIFTPDVLEAAVKAKTYASPLLLKWARKPNEQGGEVLRAQLERAAALVPEPQRARVLGPLRLPARADDPVRGAVGGLLLAKTLHDLGWQVEYEPEVDGGTPDLRITKDHEIYVVEIRRVERLPAGISEESVTRIRDATKDLQSETKISIRSATAPGTASLKPFVAYLRKLLAASPSPGEYDFNDGQVQVAFQTSQPLPESWPVVISWRGRVCHGSNRGAIRQHLDKKLKTYKVPLVVALDFYEPYDAFDHVLDVLIGQPVIRVPVALDRDAEPSEPEPGRADDGLAFDRSASGERARSRLQAVLPFYLLQTDDGSFAVSARVLANPAAPLISRLDSFSPIPRLVVRDAVNGVQGMQLLDECESKFESRAQWCHTP